MHARRTSAVIVFLGALLGGCAAKYHTVHKGLDGSATDSKNSNSVDETPIIPGQKGQTPPTAAIEMIYQGKAVSIVPVGKSLIIRPTADTIDPDNKASNCRNPGILKASYKISNGKTAELTRTSASDCGDLGFGYSFPQAGTYTIDMTVVSDENETAPASVTIVVQGSGASSTTPGGLIVTADPMVTHPGYEVNFNAACADGTGVTITWNFADGKTGTGVKITHIFAIPGQYTVQAACKKAGVSISSSVTIVVLDDEPKIDTGIDTTGKDDGGTGSDGSSNGTGSNGTGTGGTTSGSSTGTTDGGTTAGSDGGGGANGGNTDNDDDNHGKGDGGNNPGQNPDQSPGQFPGQMP